MTENDFLQIARNKSTTDLIRDAAGYKPESHHGLAHRYVIDERKNAGTNRRAWITIWVSIGSFLLSLCSLLFK